MYIYAINTMNFTANPYKKIDIKALNKIKNNTHDNARKDIYKNIDSYLSKKFTKKEFLLNLNKLAQKIDNKKLNDAERQYLDDMLTTMDLAGKNEKISDKYIIENIKALLKNQQ